MGNEEFKGTTPEYVEKQIKWAKKNLKNQKKQVKWAEEHLATWERMQKHCLKIEGEAK